MSNGGSAITINGLFGKIAAGIVIGLMVVGVAGIWNMGREVSAMGAEIQALSSRVERIETIVDQRTWDARPR